MIKIRDNRELEASLLIIEKGEHIAHAPHTTRIKGKKMHQTYQTKTARHHITRKLKEIASRSLRCLPTFLPPTHR